MCKTRAEGRVRHVGGGMSHVCALSALRSLLSIVDTYIMPYEFDCALFLQLMSPSVVMLLRIVSRLHYGV